jgi:hypothetical protein
LGQSLAVAMEAKVMVGELADEMIGEPSGVVGWRRYAIEISGVALPGEEAPPPR